MERLMPRLFGTRLHGPFSKNCRIMLLPNPPIFLGEHNGYWQPLTIICNQNPRLRWPCFGRSAKRNNLRAKIQRVSWLFLRIGFIYHLNTWIPRLKKLIGPLRSMTVYETFWIMKFIGGENMVCNRGFKHYQTRTNCFL